MRFLNSTKIQLCLFLIVFLIWIQGCVCLSTVWAKWINKTYKSSGPSTTRKKTTTKWVTAICPCSFSAPGTTHTHSEDFPLLKEYNQNRGTVSRSSHTMTKIYVNTKLALACSKRIPEPCTHWVVPDFWERSNQWPCTLTSGTHPVSDSSVGTHLPRTTPKRNATLEYCLSHKTSLWYRLVMYQKCVCECVFGFYLFYHCMIG